MSFNERLNKALLKKGGISSLEPGIENKSKALVQISQDLIESTEDHIYYNFNILNPITSNVDIPASFDITLNQPILNNPQDYNMTVIRVNLPGNDIPIFQFQPQTGSVLTGIYSVTLTYTGSSFQTYLSYVTKSNISYPSSPDYYNIYQYQILLHPLYIL